MSNDLANFKAIRQFNRLSGFLPPDKSFEKWKQTPWAAIALEVGCGAGLHPIRWAQDNGNKGIIAIERTKNKFEGFHGRLKSHKLPNIYSVNGDAEKWVPNNIKANSVDELFFLYPNPYPKERQANKRWHRNPFLQYLLECLKVGGKLYLASNESFYTEEAKLYMDRHWKLELIDDVKLNNLKDFIPRTHFEKKYLLRGETCTQLVFKKN